ncbi:MAG: NHLP bacteriocin system secretion protein [Treponema sp.]|nr:NHLP bacteriocin system secretion protein [Treponema sp.]
MSEGIFRKNALQKLSSPEQLDMTITILKPSSWITLCTLGVLLVTAIIWGIFGSIPEKVNGNGVLINSSGLTSITSASGGIVKDVFLEPGEIVHKNQIIARVERQDLLEQLQIASQKLVNLQQDYDSSVRLSQRSSGMTDEMLAKTEKDLRSVLSTLSVQILDAQRKEQNMKSLFDDGLITESLYLSARNELLTLERQKQETERQLMDTGVSRVKSTGETDQKRMTLQHQIEELRKQLDIQQEAYQNATKIVSPVSGRVYEVSIVRGSYVSIGAPVALIEPFASDGVSLGATMYFPAQFGKRISRGMNIAVTPATVKQEEYGFIQGIVTSVSEFPVSNQYLLATLQNQSLVESFIKSGTPIEVKVSLIPDPSTVSGFRWSSSKGPATTFGTGILCNGYVTVRSLRPFELVIPIIKKKVFGIGEQQ